MGGKKFVLFDVRFTNCVEQWIFQFVKLKKPFVIMISFAFTTAGGGGIVVLVRVFVVLANVVVVPKFGATSFEPLKSSLTAVVSRYMNS